MGISIFGEKVKPGSSSAWSREGFERDVSWMFLTAARNSAALAKQAEPLPPPQVVKPAPQPMGRIGKGFSKF